jgi:F-type H+-transporting ATPase subunit b
MRSLVKKYVGLLPLVMLVLALGAATANPVLAQDATPVTATQPKHPTVLSETDQYRLSPVVTKLGALLGMGPETAANVFTLFNIVVLFGALFLWLSKALPKAFKTRSASIQKGLVEARSATQEASSRLSSVESRLAKLDEQIAAMRQQVELEAAREEQRIKAAVEDEKLKIVAAAEAEIQSATTHARREIQSYAAELAIEQATRKLVVSADADRLLVESFAARLGEGSKN